jgi:hypothetical protein
MFDNEKTRNEDYMGMISWSKSYNASPRNLFGTEIKTDNPITLRINKAEETRNLSRNWYHSLGRIVEIEMSPVQWAEFLTSGNTSGVPCTIRYIGGQKMSDPKETEIFNDYNDEIEEHFDKFKEIEDVVKSAIDSKKPMGLKDLNSLLCKIHNAMSNVDFVKDSFKEDMNAIVGKAKAEFNAYVENRIHEIGIEELKKENIKFLEDKE